MDEDKRTPPSGVVGDARRPDPEDVSAVDVVVADRQRSPLPAREKAALAALAHEVLIGEGVGEGELTLSFVDAPEMEDLHLRFMNEAGPTDVLTFPMGEDGLLGDVVVCPGVAARNNPADPAAELRLLVVHGVLHALGYDHHGERDRAEMWARQGRYSGVVVP
jgi:probable rRNA maturation factor